MRKTLQIVFGVIGIAAALLSARPLHADVTVKIVVANPSASEERDIPVRYLLPTGVKKEDIVETGELKTDYDIKAGAHFVYGTVKLGAKETKTLKVVIKDVWKISKEEIDGLSTMIDDKVNAIKDDVKKRDAAQLIAEKVKERLAAIAQQQGDLAGDVEKRMQIYGAVKEKLKLIKDDIFSLDAMVAGGYKDYESKKTVALIIEAQNPTENKLETPIKYYLPPELISDYIIDNGGFEVKYDTGKNRSYLEKTVAFEPQEKKRFNIEVRNVWWISEDLLKDYLAEGVMINEKLSKTDLGAISKPLYDEIERNVNEIIEVQKNTESVLEYIANYEVNKKRVEVIRENLEKMRKLLEESMRKQEEAKNKIKNILREVNVLERLKKLSDHLFKGKIAAIGVWKIIMFVITFTIVLTTFFYIFWSMSLKKEEQRKLKKVDTKNTGA